jgi:hypothetical protein
MMLAAIGAALVVVCLVVGIAAAYLDYKDKK